MITPEEVTDSDARMLYPGFTRFKETADEAGHEERSIRRVVAFQKTLNEITGEDLKTQPEFQGLQSRLEAQLKIEDLIIKSRQAEHIKLNLYLPLVWPGVALLISLVALLLRG